MKARRLSDRYETGVAMLVAIWGAGLLVRDYLATHDLLTPIGDEALTSLIYVVPVMLAGWGLLVLAERFVRRPVR